MARKIPPLNPLHVFEVASRFCNFTSAAEELNVTQSAVSRQIATLEGYLGTQLFHRQKKGIALTAAGEAYRDEIGRAFGIIAAATANVLQEKRLEPLRVRVYNTFASQWLIPRLPTFQEMYPEILVRMNTTVAPVDFNQDDVDIAIQFGAGHWAGQEQRLLMSDVIQPVCSPTLRDMPAGVDDLVRHRLLHARYRRSDWVEWLAGIDRSDLWSEGMEFSSSLLAYQAAQEGIGIAMGQINLLKRELHTRRLVTLFEPLERSFGYYVVWPKSRALPQKARRFLAWLEDEARSA
jgi:LysR family glycine cleavage system transcriptional activator